mgnify:FL=1
MAVGLLLLTHEGIGRSLLGTAEQMIIDCPIDISILSIEQNCDFEKLIASTNKILSRLDSGDGMLILTDVFGSKPCNIAMQCATKENVCAVAGLNLSMLIRVINCPDLCLTELTDKAISGGREGVIQTQVKNSHAD